MDPDDFEPLTDDTQDVFEESEDELSMEFLIRLIDKVMAFMDVLVGHPLHEYQQSLARSIIDERRLRRG